jgi:hypothetical protein
MKRAALRYAEILEKGAWVTHQEQAEIAKLLRSLVMTEDQAWDELEARLNRKKTIKQPEQEPVAWKDKTYGNLHNQNFGNSIPLYTAPPSKPWIGLDDKDFQYQVPHDVITMKYAEAILKEKNT